MKRYGLIGYPLTHSLSEQYFTQKFIQEGIKDCVYERFSMPSIADLHEILNSHLDLRGFNITIPYKKEVLAFLTERSKAVEEVGACNCVKIDSLPEDVVYDIIKRLLEDNFCSPSLDNKFFVKHITTFRQFKKYLILIKYYSKY